MDNIIKKATDSASSVAGSIVDKTGDAAAAGGKMGGQAVDAQ